MTRGRRAMVALLAVLLAVQPALGAATATTTTTALGDDAVCDAVSFLTGGKLQCAGDYDISKDQLQDLTSIYSHGVGVDAAVDAFETVFGNYLKDTRGPARMRMQAAVAEAYKNGSTLSEAKLAAREAITDYYLTKEVNLYRNWEVLVENAKYMTSEANASGLTLHDVVRVPGDGRANGLQGSLDTRNITQNVTLMNGSNMTVRALKIGGGTMTSNGADVTTSETWGFWNYSNVTVYGIKDNGVNVSPQTDLSAVNLLHLQDPETYPQFAFVQVWKYQDYRDRLRDQRQEMLNYSDRFVENTYTEFQEGNINADDLISRLTMLEGFSQDAVADDATLNDIVIALASMGLEKPNSSTGHMAVSFVPESAGNATTGRLNLTGMLLSSNPPNATGGVWQANSTYVGTLYNSTDLNGTGVLMMAGDSGTTYTINKSHNVSLGEIVATDGSQVTNTTTDGLPENYSVVKVDRWLDLLNQTAEYYQELEEEKTTSGGGGGAWLPEGPWFPSGAILPSLGALIPSSLILLAGAYLLLSAWGGGGGGGGSITLRDRRKK